MDDNNLNYLVKKSLTSFKNNYAGTFTSDDIVENPLLKVNYISKNEFFLSFIANTLKSSKAGFQVGHWVGFVIYKTKRSLSLKYFDSFADNPGKYLAFSTFIRNIKKKCHTHSIPFKLDTMKHQIQGPYSKVCGLYAAFAIVKTHSKRQAPLKEIFAQFTSNHKLNDTRILSFLYKHWPANACHTNPIYNNIKMSLESLRRKPAFCPVKTLGAKQCMKKCKCKSCCKKKKNLETHFLTKKKVYKCIC